MYNLRSKRGETSAGAVVAIAIALVLTGILLPIGLQQIYTASTTGWDTAVITIFRILLPVLGVLAVAIKLYKGAGV